MPDEGIRPGANELVILVHLEHEVVVAAERRDRPERERHAQRAQCESDPREGPRYRQFGTGAERDDDVWHPEEVRRQRGKPARYADRRAASRNRAPLRDLRRHDEDEPAHDGGAGYEIARRSRSAERAFEPSSSWRKYA